MTSRDALKEEMIHNDDQFRQLHEEHQELERQLENLYQKRSLLSDDEEIEIKRIKHEKLRLKDAMAGMLRARQEASQIGA